MLYKYNETDDSLDEWAKLFTNRLDDGDGDHEAEYLDALKLLIAMNRNGSVLDIGAGLGRVTAMAAGQVKELVALEPDTDRYQYTYDRFHSPPACLVYNAFASDYIRNNPGKTFDLVVLGMVLQHVSTGVCKSLIKEAADLVNDSGVVIIATTHAIPEAEGFSYSNPAPGETYVSEEEYNAYAESSGHSKGIPVRRFSKETLLNMLAPYFEVIMWRQFSYYRPESIPWFAKILNVSPDSLCNVGDSQFVILRKKQSL